VEATEEFLGNAAVVRRLEACLESGRLPHALIFSGPEGVGKHTFALRLIQALNCSETGPRPCGTCSSCRKILRGTHPDTSVITVDPDASQIRIEQIRQLRETLTLSPFEGSVRGYIVDPADRLTPGAANALLKVLEEPPPDTFFFLITRNAGELLVTIRSRCQVYRFAPVSLEAVRSLGVSDELLVRWSQGSIGWARDADPGALRQTRDQMLDFLEAGLSGEPDEVANWVGSRLAGSREEYAEAIRAGYFLLSDVLHLKTGLGERVVNVDVQERLGRLAESVEIGRLIRAATQLRMVEAQSRQFLNNQLMTDALLVSLAGTEPDRE